jgi:hypothetical protein
MINGRHMSTLVAASPSRGLARLRHEPAIVVWARRLCIVVLVMFLVPSLFSAYRAWVQVRSLELIVPRREIRSGDTIRVRTVSWARTYVSVRLLLVQDTRAETLAVHQIPKHRNASLDPRWRRDSIIVALTLPELTGYDSGAATVRAIAIGGPQWMRTPPPLVRETAVQLLPEAVR